MTPFQEELYRLVQDMRKNVSPFTSAAQDSGSDLQRIVEFANKWDYKTKFDILETESKTQLEKLNKEKEEAILNSTKKVVKELLPIIDEVFLFAKYVEKGTTLDRGVKLMISNLEKILSRRKGGMIIPKVGEELDPNRHKAVEAEEIEGATRITIKEVYRYGYYLYGTVVREAEVKVICGLS